MFKVNCCDGIYNSVDVHFTSACDNKCEHCIDMRFSGMGVVKPDVSSICKTIIKDKEKFDDVLFLGGEPCLFLEELLECVSTLKREAPNLKAFVTTSVPKTCYDNPQLFFALLRMLDGINLSVQHDDEGIADKIRNTRSMFDRQRFYKSLPFKDKIRINLNIVKPYLHTKEQITKCLLHYDSFGFNSIKLSEIQHGKEYYTSFEEVFGINLSSPYVVGCQKYLETDSIIPNLKTPLLLKRSCFLCEDTLKASIIDAVKVVFGFFRKPTNSYMVVYGNGRSTKGWV